MISLGIRLTGLASAALGGIGIVVCLIGVAGVWITGSRLRLVNSEVFGRAGELVVQLEPRLALAVQRTEGVIEVT